MRLMLVIYFAAAALALALAAQPNPLFSPEERDGLVAFWNAPGRYQVGAPPEAATDGPWQVRLTADGSRWFLAYTKAVAGAEKIAPSVDAKGDTPETAAWEAWVVAKAAYDKRQAQDTAARANAVALNRPAPASTEAPPPMPGPIPPALLAAAGNPPVFYAPAAPMQATVTFPDGETLTYPDNVRVRDRFAYYRFPEGTVAYGVALGKMTDAELDPVFATGMTPAEARAARAVSKLEGGFETINTYDTGYVSIGFIQFITGEDGQGSLAAVLRREKQDAPASFALDFHKYGLDVDPDRGIVVVDPATGAELSGRDAVMAMIRDRRLVAVFQRAGRHSTPFRTAQVQVARDRYWPADDPITVTVNGTTLTGKVADVVRSEAGLATLFDRKVNRGNIRPFEDVVGKLMAERGLTALADAAPYEREIVAAMKYRRDFLADTTLAQPAPPPIAPVAPVTPPVEATASQQAP